MENGQQGWIVFIYIDNNLYDIACQGAAKIFFCYTTFMANYYLFRHGQTFFTKFHLPYFWNNFSVGILPEAVPVLERLAVYLKNIPSDLNVSSEFKRCTQSTEIITRITGNQFIIDSRLNEYYRETFGSLRERIKDFINEVNRKNYRTVIVCTHGAVMSGLKHLLLEGGFKQTQLRDYPKPGTLICIKDQKINQIDFNKIGYYLK